MNKHKATVIITIAALISVLLSTVAFAHPGRTDSKGGHWDHSTGTYHYHDGSSVGNNSNSNSNYQSYDYNYYNKNSDTSYSTFSSTDTTSPRTNNHLEEFTWSGVIAAIFIALGVFAVVAFTVLSHSDHEFVDRFYDKHGIKIGIGFLVVIVLYIAHSTIGIANFFEVGFGLFAFTIVIGFPAFLIITSIKADKEKSEARALEETAAQKQYESERNQFIEFCAGRSLNEIFDLPEDVFLGIGLLPSSPGDERWGPIYTFYTSRDKFHTRDCPYAPLDWPTNAHTLRTRLKYSHRPCRICCPELPDTDWIEEYDQLKSKFIYYKIDLSGKEK